MSTFSKEDYTLDNYQAIYEYYGEHGSSKLAVSLAAKVLRLIYNPEVTMSDATLKTVTDHVDQNLPLIFASNHLRMDDQFVVGAAIQAVPVMRQALKQGVFIPAKVDYFNGKSTMPLPMPLLESFGMMPVFRQKDSDHHKTLFRQATEMYIETSAQKLKERKIDIVSPEGTRNKTGDSSRILNLKHGVAKIALRACELDAPPLIVPTALGYDHTLLGVRGPEVHFGEPITVVGDETAAHITGELQRKLQHAVDELAAA